MAEDMRFLSHRRDLRGAGAVGVGGCAWLRWPVAGLRCVSSARLRYARALLAAAGLPPGRIYFRRGWRWGGAVAGAGGARVRVAAVGAAWRPCVASRLRSLLFARQRRRVRQQDTSRGFSTKCSAHGTSDSNTLPEYPRDPHAMERNAHTACCVRV